MELGEAESEAIFDVDPFELCVDPSGYDVLSYELTVVIAKLALQDCRYFVFKYGQLIQVKLFTC